MKIFIVNLKSKTERRLEMQKQAETLNLEVKFIDAVIGNDLSDNELKERVYDYPDCMLTKGEIGCAFSHLSIYQMMVNENIEHALILEDDAILNKNLPSVIDEIQRIDLTNKPNTYLLSKPESYISNRKIKNTLLDIYTVYDACGTHGYIINKNAAQRMIHFMMPLKWECDMWKEFRTQNIINVYCVFPTAVFDGDTEKSASALQAERFDKKMKREHYRHILKKQASNYQLKRIKNNFLKRFFLTIKNTH